MHYSYGTTLRFSLMPKTATAINGRSGVIKDHPDHSICLEQGQRLAKKSVKTRSLVKHVFWRNWNVEFIETSHWRSKTTWPQNIPKLEQPATGCHCPILDKVEATKEPSKHFRNWCFYKLCRHGDTLGSSPKSKTSMNPQEFKQLVRQYMLSWSLRVKSLGQVDQSRCL